MARAPPEPPSPMTTDKMGTRKPNISLRLTAIASPWRLHTCFDSFHQQKSASARLAVFLALMALVYSGAIFKSILSKFSTAIHNVKACDIDTAGNGSRQICFCMKTLTLHHALFIKATHNDKRILLPCSATLSNHILCSDSPVLTLQLICQQKHQVCQQM